MKKKELKDKLKDQLTNSMSEKSTLRYAARILGQFINDPEVSKAIEAIIRRDHLK